MRLLVTATSSHHFASPKKDQLVAALQVRMHSEWD